MAKQNAHAEAEHDTLHSSELHDFQQFMKQREKAASAYVRGDAAPLSELVAHESPATFFSPQGGYQEGAKSVSAKYAEDDKAFAPGGDSHFEILHMAASDGIGYWVGFQKASAYMKGQKDPIPFNLRITEIFRREGDSWKLIHRHADPLAEAQKPKS